MIEGYSQQCKKCLEYVGFVAKYHMDAERHAVLEADMAYHLAYECNQKKVNTMNTIYYTPVKNLQEWRNVVDFYTGSGYSLFTDGVDFTNEQYVIWKPGPSQRDRITLYNYIPHGAVEFPYEDFPFNSTLRRPKPGDLVAVWDDDPAEASIARYIGYNPTQQYSHEAALTSDDGSSDYYACAMKLEPSDVADVLDGEWQKRLGL